MIPDDVRTRVRQLLATGCYYDTEVAKMTGVCVVTVRAIKYHRGLVNQPGAVRRSGRQRCKRPEVIAPDLDAKPVWCPQCKIKVYLPCLRCQLKAIGQAVGHGDRYHAKVGLCLDNSNRTYPSEPAEYRTDYERYLEVVYARRCAEPVYSPPEEEEDNLP